MKSLTADKNGQVAILLLSSLLLSILLSACKQPVSSSTSEPSKIETPHEWETVLYDSIKPHPRHEATFVEYKGKFYSLGGRRIQAVDIFDPKTNTWSHGSKPPFDIHHVQAVVYQDAIIMAGAMQGGYPNETPIANLIYYYPEQDRWEVKDKIPSARLRGGAGTVIVNDTLYLVAGITNGHVGGYVPWLDKFDLITRQWTKLADAPRPRDHFQAAIANGKIYAIGGRTTSQGTKQVFDLVVQEIDQYDIASNKWISLDAKLPVPRAGTSSLLVGNDLWLLGGETNRPTPAHNEVDILDLDTLELRSFQALVEGRHGTGAILYDNAVWTCCGAGTRGGAKELKTIERIEL